MQIFQSFGRYLTSNPLINMWVLAWCGAQIIKTLLYWISTSRLNLERLTGAGGMPSSHSAMVCALAIGMARVEGFRSPLFAFALAFAGIVMFDAMGVRRAAGEHAKALNRMAFDFQNFLDMLKNQSFLEFGDDDRPDEGESEAEQQDTLKEYLGHTPLEVLAGALLGILIAMIYPV